MVFNQQFASTPSIATQARAAMSCCDLTSRTLINYNRFRALLFAAFAALAAFAAFADLGFWLCTSDPPITQPSPASNPEPIPES